MKIVSPTENLFWGALVCLAIAGIVIIILGLLGIELNTMMGIGIAGVIFALLGYSGLTETRIGFKSVPTLFGKRVPDFILDEGMGWLLPRPIMDSVEVDTRERVIKISPDPADKTSGKVLAIEATSGTGIGTTTGGKMAEADVAGEIRYKICDPTKFLSVGSEVIDDGLANLAMAQLRHKASRLDIVAFIQAKDDLATEISVSPEITNVTKEWGIEFKGFIIRKILPANADMVAAFEKQSRENQERLGEEVERNHVIRSIQMIAKELEISIEEATQLFQSERSKVKKEILRIDSGGGKVTPIEKAAAINSRGTSKGPIV